MLLEKVLHSFEAGRRGKPDELDSAIANLIAAHFLEMNNNARFDVRVNGSWDMIRDIPVVRVSGEVSRSILDTRGIEETLYSAIVDYFNKVHKTNLTADDFRVTFSFKPQADTLATNGSAGDSGSAIAVAYRKSPLFLPWERYIAVELRNIFDEIFQNEGKVPEYIAEKSGIRNLKGLRADGKIGPVDALYTGTEIDSIKNIIIAVEHEPSLGLKYLRGAIGAIVNAYLSILQEQYDLKLGAPKIITNGRGAWTRGGWRVDEGTREAKPQRDYFSSYGVNEDSFAGEDPTKPSGTGTILARNAAVQIVAHDLADFARVVLTYPIGQDDVGINVTTQGTGKLNQEVMERAIKESLPLTINAGIKYFGLRSPALYRSFVESSDLFHNGKYPWNQANISLVMPVR